MRSPILPFLLPMLLLSLGGFVAPMGVLAVYSLSAGATPGLFGNYAAFLDDTFNLRIIFDTVTLGFKVVVVATGLAIPIAMLYWHAGPRLRQAVVVLVLLPMLTSNIVRTFAWIVLLGRNGPLVAVAKSLGLVQGTPTFLLNETGLVVALAQIELPLLLLPMIAVLSRMDRRLVEAAEMAGAGPWRVMATVVLPLILPGMIAGWILVFASSATNFVTQAAIGGARLIYLPQFLYRQVNILFDWPTASVVAFVLIVTTGSVILALAMLTRHPRLIGNA